MLRKDPSSGPSSEEEAALERQIAQIKAGERPPTAEVVEAIMASTRAHLEAFIHVESIEPVLHAMKLDGRIPYLRVQQAISDFDEHWSRYIGQLATQLGRSLDEIEVEDASQLEDMKVYVEPWFKRPSAGINEVKESDISVPAFLLRVRVDGEEEERWAELRDPDATPRLISSRRIDWDVKGSLPDHRNKHLMKAYFLDPQLGDVQRQLSLTAEEITALKSYLKTLLVPGLQQQYGLVAADCDFVLAYPSRESYQVLVGVRHPKDKGWRWFDMSMVPALKAMLHDEDIPLSSDDFSERGEDVLPDLDFTLEAYVEDALDKGQYPVFPMEKVIGEVPEGSLTALECIRLRGRLNRSGILKGVSERELKQSDIFCLADRSEMRSWSYVPQFSAGDDFESYDSTEPVLLRDMISPSLDSQEGIHSLPRDLLMIKGPEGQVHWVRDLGVQFEDWTSRMTQKHEISMVEVRDQEIKGVSAERFRKGVARFLKDHGISEAEISGSVFHVLEMPDARFGDIIRVSLPGGVYQWVSVDDLGSSYLFHTE